MVDTSVILGYKSPDILSGDQRAMNQLKLQEGASNNQINQLKINDAINQAANQTKLQSFLQNNPQATPTDLAGQGYYAQAKSLGDVQKTGNESNTAQLKLAHDKLDLWSQASGFVAQNPSIQNAHNAIDGLAQSGFFKNAQDLQAAHASVPTDETQIQPWAQQHFQQGLVAKEQLPKIGSINSGGQDNFYAQNPINGQATVTGVLNKTQTPESIATNQTTATQGDLNRQNQLNIANLKLKKDEPAPLVGDSTKTGDEYIATLEPQMANAVKQLLSGRRVLTARELGQPEGRALMDAANQADNTYDIGTANARLQTQKDFSNTKPTAPGGNIVSLNTAIGHLEKLNSLLSGTAGHSIPLVGTLVNKAQNSYNAASGDPGITNYNITAGTLAQELTRAYRGAGGSEADISRELDQMSPNMSDTQKNGMIHTITDLIGSKINAQVESYQRTMGMGKVPPGLTPKTLKFYNAWAANNNTEPLGASSPQTLNTAPAIAPSAPANARYEAWKKSKGL